jgi:hypothetical protein
LRCDWVIPMREPVKPIIVELFMFLVSDPRLEPLFAFSPTVR